MKKYLALTLLLALALTAWADDKPAKRELAEKDTAGRAVKVPADAATSVLVFLRLDQPQSKKVIDQTRKLLADAKGVQVIGIVSGDDADRDAKRLVDDLKWPWPVLTDAQYALTAKFGVHVAPTTVIVKSDGTEAGHLPGAPASYEKDLEAYIDFAAGRIDPAALQKRLAASDTVADSSDQKAARHVEVAQRLVEKGLADPAKAELAKATDLKPTDPKTQLALARTLLNVSDAATAATIIAQIDPQRVSAADLNLLRGRTAILAGKWADARPLLEEAVKLNPDPSEAWYFLGQIYDHDQSPAKAAEAYRKAFETSPAGKALGIKHGAVTASP